MTAVLVVLLLLLSGLPLARKVTGPSVESVVLAPLLGAGFLAAAATAELAVGGSLVVLGTGALLAGAGVPLLVRQASRRPPTRLRAEVALLVGPCLALGWTLTTLVRYHVGWDARSIWFFHGRMLMAGRDEYLEIARMSGWTHPDYPPLVPATLGYAWELTSTLDYRTGQVVVAALTACATVLASLSVARALGSRWLGGLAATLGVLLCYGVWDAYATNGYVDPLVTALVLAGAGYGFLAGRSARHEGIALVALVLASTAKNEGLPYAAVTIGLLLGRALWSRHRREPTTALRWYVLALGAAAVWPAVLRAHGFGSTVASGAGASVAHSRLLVVLDELTPMLDLVPWAALGLGVASVVAGAAVVARSAGYALALTACTGVLLSAYAFGPHEIEWWLHTSLPRTSMLPRAGALLAAVYAAGLAFQVLLRGAVRSHADSAADGDPRPAVRSTDEPAPAVS